MAIRELVSQTQYNFPIAASLELHAGSPVARSASTGLIVAADRASVTNGGYIGLLADDTARSGNTMIQCDPVGSSYIDGNGVFQSYNNAYYVGIKRALSDFQAEDITNVTNLTAGASGYQGPARGVGVYMSPECVFVTDRFAIGAGGVAVKTADTSGAWVDTNDSVAYATNDLLTFGTGVNAGMLVKVNSANNNGKIVARVDNYDPNAGLLYITTL
jgi:hypothetical protein